MIILFLAANHTLSSPPLFIQNSPFHPPTVFSFVFNHLTRSQTTTTGRRFLAAMAAVSAATLSAAAVTCSGGLLGSSMRRRAGVAYVEGMSMSSFGGLKADNKVTSLGVPACTARSFATVVSSLRAPAKGKRGGGALSSTCNAAGEIFRIAAIMNGLVLIGVAVGFVLLRVEASLEEAE